MSAEKPEIGDVWECNGQKMIVIGCRDISTLCALKKTAKNLRSLGYF